MNQPPSHMTIELEEKDVRKDMSKIIRDMSKIRNEALKNKKLDDEQKDEYLHLTYRLASTMQAVADENMIQKMQTLTDRLSKNSILSKYDPIQDKYWQNKEKKFIQNLDDLLISIVRDDFHTIDAKHHVLQAIKYIGVEDSEFKKREEVYNSILPFQKAFEPEKENILKKFLGLIFGKQYKVETLDGLVLNVNAVKQGFSPGLIDIARQRGYTNLKVDITRQEWERIESKLPNARIVNSKPRYIRKKRQKLNNIIDKVIKYTKPISYPFLGALPQSLQERLDKKYKSFNEKNAFLSSFITEVILGGLGLSSLIISMGTGNPNYFLSIGIPSFLFFIDGAARGGTGYGEDKFWGRRFYDHSVGSIFLKPFFYPLERHFDKKSENKKIITIETSVRNLKPSVPVQSPSDYYETIARLDIPEDIKENLQWSPQNHNSFGKRFIDYVNKNIGQKPEIKINSNTDKESQSVSYCHELNIDGFRKNCSLYCFSNARYMVTTISKNNEKTPGNSENIRKILASERGLDKKARKIGKQTNARYVNLKKYQEGEVVGDIEAS
jgi:hypothetical protein